MKRIKYLLSLGVLLFSALIFASCLEMPINFVVEFESNGGTICSSIESSNIDSLKMPADPKREGFTFKGWYYDDEIWKEKFTISSILDKPLSEHLNIKVYARWLADGETDPDEIEDVGEIPKFNRAFIINFDSSGGNKVNPISSEDLSTAEIPRPLKHNYIFQGWFWDNGAPFTYASINERPLLEFPNLTVYAKWKGVDCEIKFDTNGGIISAESKLVSYMSKDFSLPVPTKEESVFEGWFFDEDYKQKATDSTNYPVINKEWSYLESTTLYAKWGNKLYNLLLYNYRAEFEFQFIHLDLYKNQIVELAAPVLEGYDFIGWFTDHEGAGLKISSPYKFDGSLETLHAHFNPKTHKIEFDEQGGTEIPDIYVQHGEYFYLNYYDYNPQKKAYRFEGWYYENEQIGEYQNYYPNKNMTLTASWVLLGHEITFYAGEGRLFIQADGDIIGTEGEPIKSYTKAYASGDNLFVINGKDPKFHVDASFKNGNTFYGFLGWYTEPNGQGELYRNDKIISYDLPQQITLYAHYEQLIVIKFFASSDLNPSEAEEKVLVHRYYENSFETSFYAEAYRVGESLFNNEHSRYITISAVKEGHTFKGWYTEANGEGIRYHEDMIFTKDTESATLYAYFVPNIKIEI